MSETNPVVPPAAAAVDNAPTSALPTQTTGVVGPAPVPEPIADPTVPVFDPVDHEKEDLKARVAQLESDLAGKTAEADGLRTLLKEADATIAALTVAPVAIPVAPAPLPFVAPEAFDGSMDLDEVDGTVPYFPASLVGGSDGPHVGLFNANGEDIVGNYSGVPYTLQSQRITFVPKRAADHFVGPGNMGGLLLKLGIRAVLGADEHVDKAATAAGLPVEEFLKQHNAAIVAAARAAVGA